MSVIQFLASLVWVLDVVLFIRIVEIYYTEKDNISDRLDAINKGLL